MAPALTNKFNGIAFWIKDGAVTQFNILAAQVNLDQPIEISPAPFEAFYVDAWGFIGGRTGGWNLTPSEVIGNVTIGGGAPATDWSAVLGGFGTSIAPSEDDALVVTGKIILEGGGFETSGSLRFGVFYNEGAGSIDSTEAGYAWTGTDDHSYGYLFLPQEGNNGAVNWVGIGQAGTYGAVVDAPWLSTDGANSYIMGTAPHRDQAAGGAGTYDFAVSVAPKADGKQEVRFRLIKEDNSYTFSGISVDYNAPPVTKKFNSVAFALNTTASTTGMTVEDLYVNLGDPIEVPEGTPVSVQGNQAALPTAFALSQNYPNPFNPATTIEFSLPQSSEVKLVVHDLAGRVVAELAAGNFAAGYHKIHFDASRLASGVYFYKLEAGSFTNVKKLMLLK
jgi:hypothetical protein